MQTCVRHVAAVVMEFKDENNECNVRECGCRHVATCFDNCRQVVPHVAVSTRACIERSCVTRLLYAPTACLELGRQEREVAMYSAGPSGVEVPLVCVVRQSAREQRSPCW
jgi:hypothetical protein